MKAKAASKADRQRLPRRPAAPAVKVPTPAGSRHPDLWYALGILIVGFAIYWRSLSGPFLFDDADLLEARSAVRLKDWYIILTGPRPLTILSFALNEYFAGFNPFSFHLVSLLLHLLNTVILWRLVRLICDSPGLAHWLTPGARNLVTFFAPALFLVTPAHTESVSYISSRSELLAATFYLLALLVFLSSWRQKRPWMTAGLVALLYACSVLGKEHALTLPGAIVLADYFFLAETDWRRLKRNWPIYAVLACGMAVGGFFKVRPLLFAPSAGFHLKDVTPATYFFTQLRMYFLYLRLLLIPFGLNADYDIQPSRTLLDHGSWLALAGLAVLAAGAIYFRRLVLASFGVLFFLLTLLPTSSFYPLLDYAAERRLYLPSIGFFLAALVLVGEWSAQRFPRKAVVTALGAILLVYASGTYARNRVWQDGLALWQDTAEKSPRKWRVYTWLGFEYSRRKMFPDATRAYQRAAELVPPNTKEQAEVLSSLGSTFNNRKMYAEAIQYYQAALRISPGISNLWTNLGMAEIRLNKPEGWSRLERAIELDPLAWEPHLARGNLYYQMARYDDAIKDYERVLNLVPDHADAQNNLRAARAMKQKTAGSSR